MGKQQQEQQQTQAAALRRMSAGGLPVKLQLLGLTVGMLPQLV
jgi:hypothetical protein